jgi:hypothetical protein
VSSISTAANSFNSTPLHIFMGHLTCFTRNHQRTARMQAIQGRW